MTGRTVRWCYRLPCPPERVGKLKIGGDAMAFTKYTKDTTIIGALGTNPAERALTTQEFKDKFDQFADEFVAWFNETHLPEVAEKAVVDEHKAETATQEGGVHGLEIESGIFTPVLAGSIVAGNHTYQAQEGYYYKVGGLAHYNIRLILSAKDASMEGYVYITGLPFTAALNATHNVLSLGWSEIVSEEGVVSIFARITAGQNKIEFYKSKFDALTGLLDAAKIKNDTYFLVSGLCRE
jgi:hypothetical protein